jgi:hypothetical protein
MIASLQVIGDAKQHLLSVRQQTILADDSNSSEEIVANLHSTCSPSAARTGLKEVAGDASCCQRPRTTSKGRA